MKRIQGEGWKGYREKVEKDTRRRLERIQREGLKNTGRGLERKHREGWKGYRDKVG